MHGTSSDDPDAGETRALPENGERLASNGAALGEKGLAGADAVGRGECSTPLTIVGLVLELFQRHFA